MSIKVSRAVWKNFRDGGNLKLTLLALADWADDRGDKIYPSMSTIAAKVCCSEVQTRRTVHSLIERGLVAVVGNEHGGKPGSSRQYRINLERLTALASDSPTALASERGINGRRLSPMRVEVSRTRSETALASETLSVIEPSVIREVHKGNGNASPKLKRQRSHATALPDSIEVTERMAQWAIEQGVPEGRVMPETEKFLDHFRGNGKRQKDWIATWRNWMRKAVEYAAAH